MGRLGIARLCRTQESGVQLTALGAGPGGVCADRQAKCSCLPLGQPTQAPLQASMQQHQGSDHILTMLEQSWILDRHTQALAKLPKERGSKDVILLSVFITDQVSHDLVCLGVLNHTMSS